MKPDEDRTIVSNAPLSPPAREATVALPSAEATVALENGDRTQMAIAPTCPVCKTSNPPGEIYCTDCGFLLSDRPGENLDEFATPPARLIAADGREFSLNPGRNTVGRANADVLLTDPSVSRSHAAITLEDQRCQIVDLGSTNGTLVNGKRVHPNEPHDLHDGDQIAFGSVSLRLALPEGYVSPPPQEAPQATVAPRAALDESPASLVDQETGKEYPIPIGAIAIGRRSANDISFPSDPYLSGRHAQVIFDGEQLLLTDVGSTNGTLVNDERIAPNEPIALHDGDLIVMGQQRFRVRLESSFTPLPEGDNAETPLGNEASAFVGRESSDGPESAAPELEPNADNSTGDSSLA